jgi:hypothetical protein
MKGGLRLMMKNEENWNAGRERVAFWRRNELNGYQD